MNDVFQQYNLNQMMNRPMGDTNANGAGSSYMNTVLTGGLLGTVFGIDKDTNGLLSGTQGFWDKKMAVYGNPRQPGPIGKIFQDIRDSLRQGGAGTNMMEGVGPGNIYGEAPSGGADASQISAPLATPSAGGSADFDGAYVA